MKNFSNKLFFCSYFLATNRNSIQYIPVHRATIPPIHLMYFHKLLLNGLSHTVEMKNAEKKTEKIIGYFAKWNCVCVCLTTPYRLVWQKIH